MTEPHFTLPKVAIQFGGEKWLCYPFLSLRRLRDERGKTTNELMKAATSESDDIFPKIDALAELIWCGRIWAEKDLAYSEVEQFLYGMGFAQKEIIRAYILAVAEALTGEKPKPEPEDSSQRPPVTDGVEA